MQVDPFKMDPEEYLDRYGVTAYLKDAVTLMLENHTTSPVEFLAQYFQTVSRGSSAVLRAFRYVRLAPPSLPAFGDNVCAAYAALDARRGGASSGVSGAELLRLLRLVCADCPLDVSRSLLALLRRGEGEPISYAEFSAAVRAAIYYDDFFKRAAAAFAACDPHGSGVAPRGVLQLALREVRGDEGAAALHGLLGGGGAATVAAAGGADEQLVRAVQHEVASLGVSKPAAARERESTVGLAEFLRALFEASMGRHPNAAALEAATARPPSSREAMAKRASKAAHAESLAEAASRSTEDAAGRAAAAAALAAATSARAAAASSDAAAAAAQSPRPSPATVAAARAAAERAVAAATAAGEGLADGAPLSFAAAFPAYNAEQRGLRGALGEEGDCSR